MKHVLLPMLFLMAMVHGLRAQTIQQELAGAINLVVAADGTGDYTTVGAAISASPDNATTRSVIFIKNGVYYEKVIVPVSKTMLTIVGEDADSVIITYDDHGDKMLDSQGRGGHTFSSYTFRADADDFHAYNLTFENTAGEISQAVAFHSNGDRQILFHCKIISGQDTYFDNFMTRRYLKDCFIEGDVDFIFGFGVSLFDSCQIHTYAPGWFTAAATPEHYEFGQVFMNCRLSTNVGLKGASLGRPWFPYSNTMFFKCEIPAGVNASGWDTWSGREKTCSYFEYQCFGEGADTTSRVAWGHQLPEEKASRYNIDTIFAASNFPSDIPGADSVELFSMRDRFEVSGYADRADTILYAGRDTFPTYPTDNWKPVYHTEVYNVIKKHTTMFMDPSNREITLEKILVDGNEVPNFDRDQIKYAVELSSTSTVPTMQTVGLTGDMTAVFTYPKQVPGLATATITAKDKATGKKYEIYYSSDSAYWDAEVSSIILNRKDTIWTTPGQYTYNHGLTTGTKISIVKPERTYTDQQYKTDFQKDSLPCTVSIKITAPNGIDTVMYTINVDTPTSTRDQLVANGKVVAISPATGNLSLYNSGDAVGPVTVKVYDLSGVLLAQNQVALLANGLTDTGIATESLASGIYIYELSADSKIQIGKFNK